MKEAWCYTFVSGHRKILWKRDAMALKFLRPEVTSEAVMATKMVVGVNMHKVFQVVDFKS